MSLPLFAPAAIFPPALTPADSVGRWAARSPAAARTLADMGLDICCGGKRPLTQACAEKGFDPIEVAKQVEAAHAARLGETEPDPATMGLEELALHIVHTHHVYLRQALPRIDFWIQKMIAAHGAENPMFTDLLKVFQGFRAEMESHMDKEENVLFPLVAAVERGELVQVNLANPVGCMEEEHESAGRALAKLSELTDCFAPPPYACTTWRAAYAALAELEADTHRHVHKENNVLFPRAVAAQAA